MKYQEIVESKVRCPKCKSDTLHLHEIWQGHSLTFSQENGTFDRKDGVCEPGDPYKVEGECKADGCGHRWTLKGVRQIDQVIKQ